MILLLLIIVNFLNSDVYNEVLIIIQPITNYTLPFIKLLNVTFFVYGILALSLFAFCAIICSIEDRINTDIQLDVNHLNGSIDSAYNGLSWTLISGGYIYVFLGLSEIPYPISNVVLLLQSKQEYFELPIIAEFFYFIIFAILMVMSFILLLNTLKEITIFRLKSKVHLVMILNNKYN